ncbi:MAG: hypothetical protein IJU31_06810 [Synergistaceae bacterium]|nr:hypothetical protein [Synergistaceae bacterium]
MLRLRGNIFMLLLLRSARDDFGAAPSYGSHSNGLTRAALFRDLIRIAKPDYEPRKIETLSQYMSQYMDGSRPFSAAYYPFDDFVFQAEARSRFENDYINALFDMKRLCHKYLKVENDFLMRVLVGGLIEAAANDDTFEFSEKGNQHNLYAFLLLIWRQIILKNFNAAEGAKTYRLWTKSAGAGRPRAIITKVGFERAKDITVISALSK